jgi:hypothetical protein
MQISAFKEYESALSSGTRLMVVSGDADTVCPWQGSYSWVSDPLQCFATWSIRVRTDLQMLRTNHSSSASFRDTKWQDFSEGQVIAPGSDFTLLKVTNASHFVSFCHAIHQIAHIAI